MTDTTSKGRGSTMNETVSGNTEGCAFMCRQVSGKTHGRSRYG